MKQFLTNIAATALVLTATAAFALPPIPPLLEEHYSKDPNGAKFAETLKMQKGKCAACHIPDADKKARGHGLNDFGKAVHDNFKHKLFTAQTDIVKNDKLPQADRDAAKAKAAEILAEALGKAAELKNAKGETYGDLIKAGTMPGDNSKKPEVKK